MKVSRSEKTFRIFNSFVLILIMFTIIVPLLYIVSVSLSSKEAVTSLSVTLWPKGLNFKAYAELLQKDTFLTSLINTVVLTIVYTASALVVNIMAAYALSKEFYAKKVITYLFIIPMYFTGGLVPTYILITNYLGLYDNFLALLLPVLVNVFYIIVIRSQIEAIPLSLTEAAMIDGANEFQVLFKIIMPTISSTTAAIGMFLALNMWNTWYSVLLYTSKDKYWTLQYFLRTIVFDKTIQDSSGASAMDMASISPLNFQMAAIVLVALPIVAIYPFVQKYFVKGMLVGSVKG